MNDSSSRRRISIIGCGWLGLPLARLFVRRGYAVKGSTTSPSKLERLRDAGVEPFLLTLEPGVDAADLDLFRSDVLFLNVPPPRGRDDALEYHVAQVTAVCGAAVAAGVAFVVFASSTSVYPNTGDRVTEEDASEDAGARGRVLLAVEDVIQQQIDFDTTIVRYAGLYGEDRNPVRYLSGRTGVAGGDAPVNLIHQDDAVGVAAKIIEGDVRGAIFNACADEHPSRRDFYVQAAEAFDLDPPQFEDGYGDGFKIVSNRRLRERLGYSFGHPDPMKDVT